MTIDPNDISLFGNRNMKWGNAMSKGHMNLPTRPEGWDRIVLSRWQWDEITDILIGSVPVHIQLWMDERFTIKTVPTNGGDIPVLYVFFGFKQELTKWRLANDISPKDTILARDWGKMEGRMFKPVPVYDWGWMRNNVKHEIILRARDIIYRAEVTFGSGPELYMSYGGEPAHYDGIREILGIEKV